MTEEQIQVHGYSTCACGALVPQYEFNSRGRRCADCFDNDSRVVREVELINRTRRVSVQAGYRKRWNDKNPNRPRGERWGSKANSPEREKAAREARQARFRAQTRLATLYPEMYQVLYAQERAAVGLPFKPIDLDLATTMETYLREHGYSAASTGGPVVDGNEPVQEDASAP